MDGTTRIGIACLSLVLLWIVVYWLTPGPEQADAPPRVTFQQPLTQPEQQPAEPAGDPDARVPAPGTDTEELPRDPRDTEPDPPQTDPEPAPVNGIIPPVFVDYTVQEGDNAWTIAERFYGTRDHWAAVLLSNPTIDARRLFRAGSVIKIAEDPRYIQGVRAGEEPPPAPRMDYIEYRVEPGDNLSAIAQALYGRASLWRFIRSANADQVNAEGTNLRPGMMLKIPPPPAN